MMSLEILDTPKSEETRRSRSRKGILLVVVLAIVAITVGVTWWFRGGDFMTTSAAGYGVAVHEKELASFGVQLSVPDGSAVVLDRVTATVTPGGAKLTWAIYVAQAGAEGFGSWHGPLPARWVTVPVNHFRVSTNMYRSDGGATYLVGSITASSTGLYRLSNIVITYHSGWRTRTTVSHTGACALFYPASTSVEAITAANDPLWQQYHQCRPYP